MREKEGDSGRERMGEGRKENNILGEGDRVSLMEAVRVGESVFLVTQGTQTQSSSQTSTASVQTSPVRGHHRNHSIHSRIQAFGPMTTNPAQNRRRSLNLQAQSTTQTKNQSFQLNFSSLHPQETPQTQTSIHSQTSSKIPTSQKRPSYLHPLRDPHNQTPPRIKFNNLKLNSHQPKETGIPQPSTNGHSSEPPPTFPGHYQLPSHHPPNCHHTEEPNHTIEAGYYRGTTSRPDQLTNNSHQVTRWGLKHGHRAKSLTHLAINQPIQLHLAASQPIQISVNANKSLPTRLTAYPRERPHLSENPRKPSHLTANPRKGNNPAAHPREPRSLTNLQQPSSNFTGHCKRTEETFSTLV